MNGEPVVSDASRRNFLAVAGLGAAAGAVAVAAPAAGASTPSENLTVPSGLAGSMAAYIHDVKKGEVALLVEGHEVIVTDRQLVARLARAFAGAKKS
jgi:hypothetical protein